MAKRPLTFELFVFSWRKYAVKMDKVTQWMHQSMDLGEGRFVNVLFVSSQTLLQNYSLLSLCSKDRRDVRL